MCSSKKGVSTNQVQRMLSCSMKTAWFLTHRIREAMRDGSLAPMGGAGGIVEVDETFIGRKEGVEVRRGWAHHKNTVLTLVERGGAARSFHIADATKEEIALSFARTLRAKPPDDRRSAALRTARQRVRQA